MPRHGPQTLRQQRRNDILACAPDIVIARPGFDTSFRLARRLGLSISGLRAHIRNEAELIRCLCQTHLNDILDAVCQRRDGRVPPLFAMGQAVLAAAAAHPARHRVYLLHRFVLAAQTQQALEARRAHIDNSFHFALHAMAADTPFCALRAPARALVGQLLHAPLWWPDGTAASQTEWLAHQIGFAAGQNLSPG